MKAPDFWYTAPDAKTLAARMLQPLGALYGMATARRVARTGYDAAVPVICVGNINVGGTGKTPTTIALVERLIAQNQTPHIVSRGYGGTLAGPIRVDGQPASETGDEPLLLSAFAPTWVAKDRAAGVRAAQVAGASVILLDDGFQNPTVTKNLSIVVVDAAQGFGNGAVIPAGPLREPVSAGLARADVLLSIGKPTAQDKFRSHWAEQICVPHVTGALDPLPTGMPWQALNLMAFAGIGNPAKFFDTLRGMGANVVQTQPLDDHQPLTDALMTRLLAEARAHKAQLVTTEKDAVRLPDRFKPEVLTLPVRLQIEDWSVLDQKLSALFA